METEIPETVLPPAMITALTPAADWVIVLPLVLALMGAAFMLMLRRRDGYPALVAIVLVLAIIVSEVSLLVRVLEQGPVSMTMGKWLPPFGISFVADAFSAGFALAAACVTLVIIVYAGADRRPQRIDDGFYALVLLLLAGVTGSFLTGDLFNLYVWFEVMLIASFGLLVMGGKPAQLDGAIKYGFINFLGTTFFLLALGLTYGLLGTLNMADLIGVAPLANPAAMAAVAGLLILAFGMKAAAFPVNAWLPASYHTPPAVVSALFAGLLTKVGAYALLRAMVLVFPTSRDVLEPLLATVAIATLVIAPLGAIAETNLRRAIGFIVIGGIGAIIAGIAMPTLEGVSGAGFYIFHAILTMTALYLVAGLVERLTGQTDSRHMGGLYTASTPVSILFFVLVLAAAGVPPLLGFWPKLLLLEAGLAGNGLDVAIAVALLVNAVLTLIAGTRLWAHIFWRASAEGQGSEHRVQPLQTIGRRETAYTLGATSALVLAIVVIGLWPNLVFEAARTAAGDMLDPARYISAVGLAGDAP